ncbi:MAG: Piwi domain-containing protein [Candidatus Firestonebacteria bacterium]
MNTIQIKLNFFAFAKQDISFDVFRQAFRGQTKQFGYYKAKLPKESGGEYADYWVTFQQQEGFNRFSCTQGNNIYLTLDLIWITFLMKIKASLKEIEYIVDDENFNRFASLIIANHTEGKEVINIEPYYLKVANKFGFLVDFRFKRDRNIPSSRKIQQLSLSLDRNFSKNKNYYSDKYDKIKVFIDRYKDKIFPLLIEGVEYHLETNLFPLDSQSLKTRIYVFKKDKESNSLFNGLKDIGPVSPITKEPIFIFIYQDTQRDLARDVYSALIGEAYPYTFPGMEKMFGVKLQQEGINKIIIKSFSKDDLKIVNSELERIKNKNTDRNILGLFIEYSKDTVTGSEFSPYYFLKCIFTKEEIPLQAVTIERIKGRDGLKWSASGIGLQIFAKLGGIPWKIKPSNEKCIIFGLGSAHKKDETGKIKKYLAYSVCMDSSGIYKKLDVLGVSENKSDYMQQLKLNIKKVISEYLTENKCIEKCVIHLPFKIKKDEILSIKESTVSVSSEYRIEFQVIKINTNNKFFGYAENNSKVPYESSYIKLSKNEYLVWFEGLQYGKENVNKAISNPVHIEFVEVAKDCNLDEEKRNKYLQDIINLSGANWRGFNAKLSPISIYYPEIIAKYIAEFRKYDENDSIDISKIAVPWFL